MKKKINEINEMIGMILTLKDFEYVAKMRELNDVIWRMGEKNLYRSYKNENYVLPTIILSCLLIFLNNGLACVIALNIFVQLMCFLNNLSLDLDKNTLLKRKSYKEYRRKYMHMDV